MNNPGLRDIPDDTGYPSPLILSIGVHILLAGFLWLGANVHHPSAAAPAALEENSPAAQRQGTPAPGLPPKASLADADPAPAEIRRAAPDMKAAKAARRNDSVPAIASSKTLADARKTNRQAPHLSERSSKPAYQRSSLAARASTARPVSRTSKLAGKDSKARAASTARTAKAESLRDTKRNRIKQAARKPDANELKKLESMREAELRRISKNLS